LKNTLAPRAGLILNNAIDSREARKIAVPAAVQISHRYDAAYTAGFVTIGAVL
jgi:hypothetical protein